MIIIQLDSQELSNVIQKAVRIALADRPATLQPEADQLLTTIPAAKFLDCAVPTLYAYVQRKEIPVNKRGRRLYFSKQELTEWVKAGRKKTASEIKSEAGDYLLNTKKKGGKL